MSPAEPPHAARRGPLRAAADTWAWSGAPRPQFVGGNDVRLLVGGDALFPAMCDAIAGARSEVWLATYIFHDDAAAQAVADCLVAAARRGVAVHVVIDGFGALGTLPSLRRLLQADGLRLEVFRPLDRWWAWLQPGQLRRLHQKLCVVDGHIAFVGGINIIDDRHDLNHGWTEHPRLDFAVRLHGAVALQVQHTVRAIWTRAQLGQDWRAELRGVLASAEPVGRTLRLLRELRGTPLPGAPVEGGDDLRPVRVAFVVRDNFRQRRAIERSYVESIRRARHRVDIACSYFYPGRAFMRTLRQAARRGVRVRLLLQGKIDYRIAALAARVLYDELLRHGVEIYEYTPAFLHAKVAVVDDDWATVGSSNIDPLSLLLNLEANAVVRDGGFARELAHQFDVAAAASVQITAPPLGPGWRAWWRRGLVAWLAGVYLRLAGITGRY